jgi:hypothetical protein
MVSLGGVKPGKLSGKLVCVHGFARRRTSIKLSPRTLADNAGVRRIKGEHPCAMSVAHSQDIGERDDGSSSTNDD